MPPEVTGTRRPDREEMSDPRRTLAGVLIGAHVVDDDPLAAARARDAQVVQFFLTDPQGWKSPRPRPDADALREAGAAAAAGRPDGVAVYVHAPYVINVASTNNRIRIPSRALLAAAAKGAVDVGARGLVVHGGHVAKGEDPAVGFANWRKVFAQAEADGGFGLPVLIENTAGGDLAMARRFDALARLWDAIGAYDPGFCLDTCHAHAGGEELLHAVDRAKAITGRIDLVHANDSKDPFDSGRDRHENLGRGRIDPDLLVAVVAAAGAPVVCETPGGEAGQAADIAFLRERLPT